MNVIIIGASGFLGSTIYKELSEDSNNLVIGTYNHNQIDIKHVDLDVCNELEVTKLISSVNPDVIIWSICDMKREDELSQSGLKYLLKNISDTVKIIYVSTTIATGPLQTEMVEPVYRTKDMYLYNYVNGKINAENLVKTHANHIIVRPGSIYGNDGYKRLDTRTKTIKDNIESKSFYLRANNLLTPFVDVRDLTKVIVELTELDYVGTINIAGSTPISHYHFSIKRAHQLGLDSSYIVAETKDMYYEYSLDVTKSRHLLKTDIKNI